MFSSSVDVQRQMATVNQIEEEEAAAAAASESRKSSTHQDAVDDARAHANHPSHPLPEDGRVLVKGTWGMKSAKKKKEHKLQRDKTVREELHMYSKELTERVNREQAGDETEHGEAKWGNILYVFPRVLPFPRHSSKVKFRLGAGPFC